MGSQPESALVKDIRVSLRHRYGGLWIKTHGGPYAQQGVPDLIGCVDGLFIGLEVKMPGKEDTLTPLQKETLLQINVEGGHAKMVTSVDEALEVVALAIEGDFVRPETGGWKDRTTDEEEM